MKRNAAKLALVMLAIIVMSATLMGCDIKGIVMGNLEIPVVDDSNNNGSGNGNSIPTAIRPIREPSGPGFKVGFVCGDGMTNLPAPLSGVQFAVISDYSIYDVDDVSLDYYYGGFFEEYGPVCYAFYFCNGQDYYPSNKHFWRYDYNLDALVYNIYDDYHNIDGYYFVKELSATEANSGKYSFSTVLEVSFNYHEILTVPSSVFIRERGSFVITVASVRFSELDNGYKLWNWGYLYICYEYLDEYTVMLSEATFN